MTGENGVGVTTEGAEAKERVVPRLYFGNSRTEPGDLPCWTAAANLVKSNTDF